MKLRRMAAAAAALAASTVAGANEWNLSVTPYLWATDTGIGLTIVDRELVDATIPFADLLQDVQAVAQLRAEAMRGAHGLSLDLFTVELADHGDRIALPDPVSGELVLDSQVGMTILDLAGVYDPDGDGLGLSLTYGTRVLSLRADFDAEYTPAGEPVVAAAYDTDDRFVDGLVGLRYAGLLSGNWRYELAADLSAGDTDYTWSVAPAVGYRFGDSDQYTFTAGYRHMVVDFDTPATVDLDMALSGFLLGFRIQF